MAETRINLYEGLFLLAQGPASSDFGGCVDFLRETLERAEAEILVLRKWDDRRLAYSIAGQKRGTYLLAYFRARSTQIANIERDCNLSEQVLRAMMLKADHIGDVELELEAREPSIVVEQSLRERAEASRPAEPETEAEAPQAETTATSPPAETEATQAAQPVQTETAEAAQPSETEASNAASDEPAETEARE